MERLVDQDEPVCLFADGQGARQMERMGVKTSNGRFTGSVRPSLAEIDPWGVLVGSSENTDTYAFDLIAEAANRRIPSIGGVDGFANADSRFRGHSSLPLAHAPNWLLLPDEMTQREFVDLGFADDHAVVCGHPYYDKVREYGARLSVDDRTELRWTLFPKAQDRDIVVFLSEISGGLTPDQYLKSAAYTLAGRGLSVGRTEVVVEEFLDAAGELPQRPYLVLRLHPKNDEQGLRSYYPEFDEVNRGGQPLDVACVADLVVGMSTSLLVEAAIIGCQTLSILPRLIEREWLPTTAAGTTPTVFHRKDIGSAISAGLNGVTPQNTDELLPPGAAERALGALFEIREGCCA